MAMGNKDAGNAFDYYDNPGYSKYATWTRKDAKNAGELGAWNQWRGEQMASQTHRQQEQDTWWRRSALNNALMGIEGARTQGNQGFQGAYDRYQQFGNRADSMYDSLNARLPGFFDKARGYYDKDVEFGNIGDKFYADNLGNPLGYRNHLVGELDPRAIMRRAEEAREASLKASNARSGLNTLAFAGAEEARHRTALEDEQIAYGRHRDDMGDAWRMGMRGAQGRMNQANLTQGEWDATQRLGQSQINNWGSVANAQANNLLQRGMFNANLTGNAGDLKAQTDLAQLSMGRGDFKGWQDRMIANDEWVKNALYSDMVRQQMMDFQREQADSQSKNQLLGSILGIGGKLLGGGFGTALGGAMFG